MEQSWMSTQVNAQTTHKNAQTTHAHTLGNYFRIAANVCYLQTLLHQIAITPQTV